MGITAHNFPPLLGVGGYPAGGDGWVTVGRSAESALDRDFPAVCSEAADTLPLKGREKAYRFDQTPVRPELWFPPPRRGPLNAGRPPAGFCSPPPPWLRAGAPPSWRPLGRWPPFPPPWLRLRFGWCWPRCGPAPRVSGRSGLPPSGRAA